MEKCSTIRTLIYLVLCTLATHAIAASDGVKKTDVTNIVLPDRVDWVQVSSEKEKSTSACKMVDMSLEETIDAVKEIETITSVTLQTIRILPEEKFNAFEKEQSLSNSILLDNKSQLVKIVRDDTSLTLEITNKENEDSVSVPVNNELGLENFKYIQYKKSNESQSESSDTIIFFQGENKPYELWDHDGENLFGRKIRIDPVSRKIVHAVRFTENCPLQLRIEKGPSNPIRVMPKSE